MAASLGITANLRVKNELSPELQEVIKLTKKSAKEFLGLDETTQSLIKEMKKIKQTAEQNERAFDRETKNMVKEINDLRREIKALNATKAHPSVSMDDQARKEIAALKQEIKALNGTKAKVQVETGGGDFALGGVMGGLAAYGGAGYIDTLIAETKATARRALMGDTPEELLKFQREAQELSLINPDIDRSQVKELMIQANRFNELNGVDMTRQAMQLSAIRPDMGGADEFLTTQMAMQNAMPEVDIKRIGDSLGYIALTARDLRKDTLDSLQEYSSQMTGFIDAPEKMAMLVESMNQIWNTDTGFDALKETGLKLNNVGDMENILKTAYGAQGMDAKKADEMAKKEAEQIGKLLSSGSKQDRQYATGVLMQTFASIKDEFVRQNLLNELAGGPGENVGDRAELVKLLQKGGELAKADPTIYRDLMKGKLNENYQSYKENNPLQGFLEAKTMLSNELVSLGTTIAQDLGPAIKVVAEWTKTLKDALDSMPPGAAIATFVGGATTAAAGLYVFYRAVIGAGQALTDLVRRQIGGGGGGPDIDIDLDDDKGNGKRRRRRKGGSSSRPGGKKVNFPDLPEKLGNPKLPKASKVEPPIPNKAYFQNLKGKVGGLIELGGNGAKELLSKTPLLGEAIKGKLGGVAPEAKTLMKGIAESGGGLLKGAKGLLRNVPWLGVAIGATEIATADNKLETAGRVGSQALGGWGGAAVGAATGAAIGSVVPLIGTAIGGAVGGIIGGFGGSMAGDALFDEAKQLWTESAVKEMRKPMPAEQMAKIQQEAKATKPVVLGPPIPTVSPISSKTNSIRQLPNVTIQSMPITLRADGVLQDVAGMLKLLRDPTVSKEIKNMIEKEFIDAIETMGGVSTTGGRIGGVPM